MSFRVLVIPEDFRKDEPLLTPILEKMLEACGRKAKVRVCKDPLLGGIRVAGLDDLPRSWSWKSVRAEPNAKEAYFERYVREKGLTAEPFGGRLRLGQKAAQNYPRIRKLCPEDVEKLEGRLK